jgi:hypothetical protein
MRVKGSRVVQSTKDSSAELRKADHEDAESIDDVEWLRDDFAGSTFAASSHLTTDVNAGSSSYALTNNLPASAGLTPLRGTFGGLTSVPFVHMRI